MDVHSRSHAWLRLGWLRCCLPLLLLLNPGRSMAWGQALHLAFTQIPIGGTIYGTKGLAMDQAGKLFVTRPQSGSVVKVSRRGDGTYSQQWHFWNLNNPRGIAVDASGNLFICGSGADALVKASLQPDGSYVLTRIHTSASGTNGIALDASGSVFLAGSAPGKNVFKETPNQDGSYTETLIPTSADYIISDVAVDAQGNLFLSDPMQQRILKETVDGPDRYLESVAIPSPDAGSSQFLSIGADGSLFSSNSNNAIYRWTPQPDGSYARSQVGANLPSPGKVAMDALGNLFVTNNNGYSLIKIQTSTPDFGGVQIGSRCTLQAFFQADEDGTLHDVQTRTAGVQTPTDFTAAASGPLSRDSAFVRGNLYEQDVTFSPSIPGLRKGVLDLFTTSGFPTTRVYLKGTGLAPQASLGATITQTAPQPSPSNLLVDGAGSLYFLSGGQILHWDPSSGLVPASFVSGPPIAAFTLDQAGSFYWNVAGSGQWTCLAWNADGTPVYVDLGSRAFESACVDSLGNVYFGSNGTIEVLPAPKPDGTHDPVLPVLQVDGSQALAVDGNDRLYILDTASSLVYLASQTAGSWAVIDRITVPSGTTQLAVDALGSFYLAGQDGRISQYTSLPDGTTRSTGILAGVEGGVTGLAVDGAGRVFYADGLGRINLLDRTTPATLTMPSTPAGTPSASERVLIQNIGNRVLNLAAPASGTNPSPGSANFSLAAVTPGGFNPIHPGEDTVPIAPGDAVPLDVLFTPIIAGAPLTDNLRVVDNSLNLNGNTQVLPLEGTATQGTSAISLASSPGPYQACVTVTFTATVTPSCATGTVTFLDQGSPVGTATLVNGSATLAVSTLLVGGHTLTATYPGNASFAQSSSTALTLAVSKGPATTTLASSQTPAPFGAPVTLTANVAPASATGTVTFMDQDVSLGTATLANGSATLAVSSLAIGDHTLTATYSGDTNFDQGSSVALTQVVTKVSTTTTLASSQNPAPFFTFLTLTATVAPASATGTVSFLDHGSFLGTVPISGGSATFPLACPAIGSHTLTAVYSGDTTFDQGSPAPLTLVVTKGHATTTLASSQNPAPFGTPVTLTATVAPACATGTLTFLDQGVSLGTATLVNGSASLTLSSLAAGSHAFTTAYSGDTNFDQASPTALTQVVAKAPTTTTLTSSASSASFGGSLTFTATVAPAGATGTVTFMDQGVSLGTADLVNGSATLAMSSLAAGSHALTATYSGDANHVQGSSAVLAQVVTKALATITMTSTPNPAPYLGDVTYTITLTPAAATGTVTIHHDGYTPFTIPIYGGSTDISIPPPPFAGTYHVTAVYSGDANVDGGSTAVYTQVVAKAPTTMTLATSQSPAPFGTSVTINAKVSPASATGYVTIRDQGAFLGTAILVNGSATLAISNLAAGSHTLTATYSGDEIYTQGPSLVSVTQVVTKDSTTTTLASSLSPAPSGTTLTFTATVTPANATGTVTFLDQGTPLGTALLVNGSAALTLSSLSIGSHAITASYSGDANYTQGSPANLTQVVTKDSTTTTLASSLSPAPFGATVTITASVTPSSATGTVTFMDQGVSLGTASLANDSATLALSSLSVGSHALTATYSGDANHTQGSPALLTQVVTQAPSSTKLSSSLSPAPFGAIVTFTATVTPASATGIVTFLDQSTPLGTATLANGKATLALASLPAGEHAIIASYVGDANFLGMTSAPLIQDIAPAVSTLSLAAGTRNADGMVVPAATATVGQTVVLTAAVGNASAGTVAFLDNGTTLGSSRWVNGSATFAATFTTAGAHVLTASFVPDDGNSSTASATCTLQVDQLPVLASATALTLPPSGDASLTLTFGQDSTTGPLATPITLSISGLPAGVTAEWSSTTLTSLPGSVTLKLRRSSTSRAASNRGSWLPWGTTGGLVCGFLVLPGSRRRRRGTFLALLAFALLGGLTACGGKDQGPSQDQVAPGTYTITVTASSAGTPISSTTLTMKVTQ